VVAADRSRWHHAAGPEATAADLEAASMLECCLTALNSNAVAIGGAGPSGAVQLFGAGAGQMDRVTACRLASEKAGEAARGAVCVSDAFFPFPDGPRILIEAGVRTIVHPGGSRRDEDTFRLCEEHGVSCITTGVRRFSHEPLS
ncbi:MAG: bifunctional phosphoribosylaminoimidazolecarboxamide formyltransferase/IMP cyclohydrolase, partial [Planctomycetota bacterium]